MSRRRRRDNPEATGHPCRVYWGSHGCRKQWPHLGGHYCTTGCWAPTGTDRIFGEDALAEYAAADELARRQLLNAPATRPVQTADGMPAGGAP